MKPVLLRWMMRPLWLLTIIGALITCLWATFAQRPLFEIFWLPAIHVLRWNPSARTWPALRFAQEIGGDVYEVYVSRHADRDQTYVPWQSWFEMEMRIVGSRGREAREAKRSRYFREMLRFNAEHNAGIVDSSLFLDGPFTQDSNARQFWQDYQHIVWDKHPYWAPERSFFYLTQMEPDTPVSRGLSSDDTKTHPRQSGWCPAWSALSEGD